LSKERKAEEGGRESPVIAGGPKGGMQAVDSLASVHLPTSPNFLAIIRGVLRELALRIDRGILKL
jgi:hypothetical protein